MTSETYDYIIVGAGSAGCVLADRLTACGRHKVLILEAGGSDRKFWIKTPLGYGKTFDDARVNWCYETEPDAGLNGRRAFWPRGKVIGGSSSINAMAYLRGLPHDFADWELAGATGWGWDTVRGTYEGLETNVECDPQGMPIQRGKGPLWVSDLRHQMHPFRRHFTDAASDLGWPVRDTLNGNDTDGITHMRSTVRDGKRWSAADAFLRPALERDTLRLISGVLVERIEITDGRASGVTFAQGDRRITAHANAEVIISAGAINSPHLLQLSGIGAPDHLASIGVDVTAAVPEVGRGLQDHLGVSHFYHATEPTLNAVLGHFAGQVMAGVRYVMTRRGPLAVPVNQVSGFVRSTPDTPVADMQIYCNPMSYRTDKTGKVSPDTADGFLLCAQPCRPTSRGEIMAISNTPTDAPAIRPNSLATNHDCAMAIRAGRVLKHLAETPALCAVTKTRQSPDVTIMNDAEMLENFRDRAGTIFHPTSTCRMGHDITDSVLDHRLRVHGVRGLRVVDASAFPNVTSGNTNAPVMMLAARGAELILEDAHRAHAKG